LVSSVTLWKILGYRGFWQNSGKWLKNTGKGVPGGDNLDGCGGEKGGFLFAILGIWAIFLV
jgi:hypothetical protein